MDTTIWYQSGVSHPNLSSLVWEIHRSFLPPTLPLSRSCQAPKVINPSIMITKAVVLCSGINKPLSDGPVPSITVHKQLVPICLGVHGLSPMPHVDRQSGGKDHSSKDGVSSCRNREISIMYLWKHQLHNILSFLCVSCLREWRKCLPMTSQSIFYVFNIFIIWRVQKSVLCE